MVGLSEAPSKEVGALGVKVTVVKPGPFRTDWAGRSLQSSPNLIPAYAETVHARLRQVGDYSGKQPGDPTRAAQAIIAAVDSEAPPLNLVLGAPWVADGAPEDPVFVEGTRRMGSGDAQRRLPRPAMTP